MDTRTAFGASWLMPPAPAAAVLRAQASSSVTLVPVSVTDAAAAVIGAHVWAAVLGQTSLAAAAYQLPGDVAVAVAVLSRAAGHRAGVDAGAGDCPASPSRVAEEAVAAALRWLPGHLDGVEAAAALTRAAGDLCAGEGAVGHQELAYAAALLEAEADLFVEDPTDCPAG